MVDYMDLKKVLEGSEAILLRIKNDSYSRDIMKIIGNLNKKYGGSVYVNLNKIHPSLLKNMKQSKINEKNIFFIDVVTKSTMSDFQEPDNCVCVDSPSNLTGMSIAINEVLKADKFQCMIFDSLSTVLIQNKPPVVANFVKSIINKARSHDTIAVFTILDGETEAALVKKLGMFVDKTVEYK
jgi:hypothetical protein